jgi:hypothetical protein
VACAVAAAALGTVGLAACGGGDDGPGPSTSGLTVPTPQPDDEARFARAPSVEYNSPPPAIAAQVRQAAARAGCTTRGFPAEPEPPNHVGGDVEYKQSVPPTNGPHNEFWADYGVYETPVPEKHLVHNLEHGGVVVHIGSGVSKPLQNALRVMWAEKPAFMVLVPGATPGFPEKGVVVTSWQRWLVCKPLTRKGIAAIEAYRDVYRGTGPEGISAVDVEPDVERPDSLPKPTIPDPGARPN